MSQVKSCLRHHFQITRCHKTGMQPNSVHTTKTRSPPTAKQYCLSHTGCLLRPVKKLSLKETLKANHQCIVNEKESLEEGGVLTYSVHSLVDRGMNYVLENESSYYLTPASSSLTFSASDAFVESLK
ncbi:hypothetical protein CDAR_577541 [Caerostris darwini]|uniref:Uncharacterized protein n=1 Tax=Caerostris darwini TaxID=1538125 RepID=A0AAV4SEL8_9ARAC|nr:hypothetical protein CDAR_577541 [Caerostris darwini]